MVLADPQDTPGDVVVLPAARAESTPGSRVVLVAAPRWKVGGGGAHHLAQAYRDAVAAASARSARTLVLPGSLTRGPWPLDDVTRIALTVLLSTPSTVREVTIAVHTPAMLERWAEALVREL